MTRLIVGISGPAGSGKSAFADRLCAAHGFTVVSLADPIKRVVSELMGFTDRQLYGPSSARSEPHPTLRRPDGSPLTARHALQSLGTDWARSCCPDVWIVRAMKQIAETAGDVVIPDVRFLNELAAVREAGGFMVRRKLDRPVTDQHPTEREMMVVPDSEFAAVLGQAPSLGDLHAVADLLVAGWRSEVSR